MSNSARSDPEPSRRDVPRFPSDSVDALLASWRARRSDLDFSPLAVVQRLDRVNAHVSEGLEELLGTYGLSMANYRVLATLARLGDEGRISQTQLLDELGLTSGTMSVRIDRLVELGLVNREPDPESKRATVITLTAAGRELFERVAPAHLANERRLLAALSDEEEEELVALLRKLLVEFEGSPPPADPHFRLGLSLAPAHVASKMRESVGLLAVPALLVRAVAEGGPAAVAGIRSGDLLVASGRRQLRSIDQLYAAIEDASTTRRLAITLLRGSTEERVTIKLDGVEAPHTLPASLGGRSVRDEHHL